VSCIDIDAGLAALDGLIAEAESVAKAGNWEANERAFSARFAVLAAATAWMGNDEAIEEAHSQAYRDVYGSELAPAPRWTPEVHHEP
jgi:hypothetical protein